MLALPLLMMATAAAPPLPAATSPGPSCLVVRDTSFANQDVRIEAWGDDAVRVRVRSLDLTPTRRLFKPQTRFMGEFQ